MPAPPLPSIPENEELAEAERPQHSDEDTDRIHWGRFCSHIFIFFFIWVVTARILIVFYRRNVISAPFYGSLYFICLVIVVYHLCICCYMYSDELVEYDADILPYAQYEALIYEKEEAKMVSFCFYIFVNDQ